MSEQWCSWVFIDGRAYLTKGVYPLVLYCLDHDYNFDYTKYVIKYNGSITHCMSLNT